MIAIAFVLVILPLIQFVVMKLYIFKHNIKEIAKKSIKQFFTSSQNVSQQSMQAVHNGCVDLIIDDNMRKNATICEM